MRRYKTMQGNLLAREMTDSHLIKKVEYEINKLNIAKTIINQQDGEALELTSFQRLRQTSVNKMTIDKAEEVIEEIEDVVAGLILELMLRSKPVDVYVSKLRELLDKDKEGLDTAINLFLQE